MTYFEHGEYRDDGEHTHAQPVPFVVWALLLCAVVLAVSIAGLAVYLTGRATLADQRNAATEGQTVALRLALCTALEPVPPGRLREVDRARALRFPVNGGTEALCAKLPPPKPTPTSTAHPEPTMTVTASPPAPQPTVTVTATRTATTRAKPTASRTPPRPTPTPTPTCIVIFCP